MTEKEAIKNIQDLLDGCCGPELDDTREAMELAIKALEAQECEDAVGRKSVLSALREEDRGGYIDCATEYVLGVIRRLPSTQPEYEPVKAEDFARTMSKNTIYSFMAWHGEALELMEIQGFVICKKTM